MSIARAVGRADCSRIRRRLEPVFASRASGVSDAVSFEGGGDCDAEANGSADVPAMYTKATTEVRQVPSTDLLSAPSQ